MSVHFSFKGYFWGSVLIGFGVLLLLDNLNVIDFGEFIARFWPVFIIIIGLLITFTKKEKKMDIIQQQINSPNKGSMKQIRPWVRYWAKTLDITLFALASMYIISIFSESLNDSLIEMNEATLSILVLFFYIFYEAILHSLLGTTPGKSLLKIELRNSEGNALNFDIALKRSFLVWLQGFGCGIPLISLICMLVQLGKLEKKGKTSWDAKYNLHVYHHIIGLGRTIITIISVLLVFILIFIGRYSE